MASVFDGVEGVGLALSLSLSEDLLLSRDGGGPMMPPSINLKAIGGGGGGSSLGLSAAAMDSDLVSRFAKLGDCTGSGFSLVDWPSTAAILEIVRGETALRSM